MSQAKFKTAYWLSGFTAALAFVASVGGLLLPKLYRDPVFITSAFRGNDAVTLFVAVPLMDVCLVLSGRGSRRTRLVWLGTLAYILYNYAYYLFAAALNAFFLLYVVLFALPIFALVFSVPRLDINAMGSALSERTPVRPVAGYMLLSSLFIGGLWLSRIVGFFVTGEAPVDITQTGHPTGIVFALDLSVMVPWVVLGALWLWQRRPWGYVLSVVMLVKGAAYPLALVVMSAFSAWAGTGWDALTWLWVTLTLGGLASCFVLLKNLNTKEVMGSRRSRRLTA